MRTNRSLLFLALVLVALGGLGAWWFTRSNPYRQALRVRELATWGMADYLAKTRPGRHVLVLSNPFTQRRGTANEIRQAEDAGLGGLKRGFGTKLSLAAVVFPDLKPDALTNPRSLFIDRETTTPLSYLVAPDAFDKAVNQHPDCELVVSLIGVPVELGRVQCWQRAGPPHFALLLPDLRMIGDANAVRQAVGSGKLAAFVLPKPGAPTAESALNGSGSVEFERRFVLVTGENFEQVLRTYPGLFPRR